MGGLKKKGGGSKQHIMLAARADLAFGPFRPLPNFPLHLFPKFLGGFYKSDRCAGEVINYTLKTVSDFPRVHRAKQLDLLTESISLSFYSYFFSSLSVQWSSHTYNSSSWRDGKPDGKVSSWVHSIPPMTTRGQDKVKSSIKYVLIPLITLYRQRKKFCFYNTKMVIHLKWLKHDHVCCPLVI